MFPIVSAEAQNNNYMHFDQRHRLIILVVIHISTRSSCCANDFVEHVIRRRVDKVREQSGFQDLALLCGICNFIHINVKFSFRYLS